ncbi:MAG: flagellar export protein FliJ [bacterium]
MFRFRLQRVLRYRVRLEDQQARRVQQAAATLQKIRGRQELVRATMKTLAQDGAEVRNQSPSIWLWRMQTDYLARQQTLLDALALDEMAAQDELRKQQQLLTRAHQDREVLERLKAKQHREWQQEEQRRERKQMDEVGSQRAWRHGATHLP